MTDNNQTIDENEVEAVDENKLIAQRREKLNEWRETDNAYPNDFKRTHLSNAVVDSYDANDKEWFDENVVEVKLAGRLMSKRIMGKASFAHIQDQSGRIQMYVHKATMGEEAYEYFKHMDIGDIVGISGSLFKTKVGELSVKTTTVSLLSKSLRPLPEKFHGMTDQEMRYRMRYVDLIVNEKSKNTFVTRSKLINYLRNYLNNEDYLEIESPMMQSIPGGASAKPFVTHHKSLDLKMYLRVAQELYIKRCLVGGFDKVFELNRNFRNEGLSTRHNPEFTMLEFNEAYKDYIDYMDMTEDMIRTAAKEVLGTQEVDYGGKIIDFSIPFDRLTVVESIVKYTDVKQEDIEDLDKIRAVAKSLKVHVKDSHSLGEIQMEIFDACVEDKIWHPTYVTAYPIEISPLARRSKSNPSLVDRFELFIAGREFANGYSELNDPEDQTARLLDQAAAKDAGDEEAMYFDADYIRAMEYGMPPNAGSGIGIDRLVMLFTDSHTIRDVILFPHMRPENNDSN